MSWSSYFRTDPKPVPSFVDQTNERTLPSDYRGDILLWDIDKTYLDTRFSSKRGLFAIPFEAAIDKRSIPGAVPLLRALRRGGVDDRGLVPLYFVSGSPPQLRRIIEKKMTMDGIQYDGLSFKDQWGLVRAGRPRDVKRQLGYKLKALLAYWRTIPRGGRWWMFGDDVEDDAEAFVLFGRACGGLRDDALEAELDRAKVHRRDRTEIHGLLQDAPTTADPVERVLIHLTRRSPVDRFAALDKVVPCRSHLQTALVMAQAGRIRPEAITAVAHDLRRHRVVESELGQELQDAKARLGTPEDLLDHAQSTLDGA